MRTTGKPTTSHWKPFSPAGLPAVKQRTAPTWRAAPAAAVPWPPLTDRRPRSHQNRRDHRDLDEHWTALTAYLADMYFPNEG